MLDHIPNTDPIKEDAMVIDSSGDNDAGIRAAERARQRAVLYKNAARKIFVTICMLVFLAVACVVGLGYYLWTQRVTTLVTDERPCSLKITENLTITGKRSYSYPYTELMGFGWRRNDQITTKTQIDVPSKGLTVIGLNDTDETWWAFPIGQAEGGIRILKPADRYVFHVGNDVGVVTATTFCR